MKKIIYSICALFLLGACNDILEEEPKSIATETFYNTVDEVEAATNAIYYPIRNDGCFGCNYPAIMVSLADNTYGKASFASLSEYQGLDATNISRTGSIWTQLYLSIRNANLVIQNTPNGSETTEDEQNQFIGEARFMRALDYFFLVRCWGGVPIRTEETMDEINIARSSVEKVYELILSDLAYAETNLPDNPRLAGTPSKWVAKTVLADVYMQLKDWDKAEDLAREVIDSGKYSLVQVTKPSDFDNIFGPDIPNTPEEIFYLKYTRGESNEGWKFILYNHISGSGYYGAGGYYAFYTTTDNAVIKNWDDNDFRKQNNLYSWDIGLGDNTLLFKKFCDPDATTKYGGNDYPMYRYADLLMLYAQAATKANNAPTADAVECLNKVHRRAYGLDPETVSAIDYQLSDYDKDSFIDLILKEQGYETLNEGKRWLELVRTGKVEEIIKETKGIDIASKQYLFPIPTSETSYNDSISSTTDQNPGY